MPTKPNKRGGDKASTWKIIQNNDSRDDLKFWKQNGVTEKYLETRIGKMQEMYNKNLEEKSINN